MITLFDHKRAANNHVEEEKHLVVGHLDFFWTLHDAPSNHILIIQLEGQVLLDADLLLLV